MMLENDIFQFVITLLTVYALFGDDVRVLAFTLKEDPVFDVLTILSLISFSIEILFSVISRVEYPCSFFFWLDLISTASLVLDIQMVSETLFSGEGGQQSAQLAKAGKASRVGTRAGRIVRLVRLIRIVKLYKAASDTKPGESMKSKLKSKMKKKNK